jgi:predicted RNase H-like HicB family nuclease
MEQTTMAARKHYLVECEQDPDGWWVASVRGVKGCHTQGRSVETVARRIREALSLFVNDAETAGLTLAFKRYRPVLDELRRAKVRAERARRRADDMERRLARSLVAKMSRRDAGAVLGLTGQRVDQIVKA